MRDKVSHWANSVHKPQPFLNWRRTAEAVSNRGRFSALTSVTPYRWAKPAHWEWSWERERETERNGPSNWRAFNPMTGRDIVHGAWPSRLLVRCHSAPACTLRPSLIRDVKAFASRFSVQLLNFLLTGVPSNYTPSEVMYWLEAARRQELSTPHDQNYSGGVKLAYNTASTILTKYHSV